MRADVIAKASDVSIVQPVAHRAIDAVMPVVVAQFGLRVGRLFQQRPRGMTR
jgi:hypothetical protein